MNGRKRQHQQITPRHPHHHRSSSLSLIGACLINIKIAYGKRYFPIYQNHYTVPVAISAHPMSDFIVNVSCKKKTAIINVKTILEILSTAATSVALPI